MELFFFFYAIIRGSIFIILHKSKQSCIYISIEFYINLFIEFYKFIILEN